MPFANSHLRALYLDSLETGKDLNELSLCALNQLFSLQFEASRKILSIGRRQWPDLLSNQELPLLMQSWQTSVADSLALTTQLTRDLLDATSEIQRQFARLLEKRIPKLTAELVSEAEEMAKSFAVPAAGVVPFKTAQKTTQKAA